MILLDYRDPRVAEGLGTPLIMTSTITEPRQWFCFFRSDAGRMAVPLQFVAEILETDSLVRLAWSPPQVIGLCSFHREVVPVVLLGASSRGGGDARSARNEPSARVDQAMGERAGEDELGRNVVLILRTEQVPGEYGSIPRTRS